MSEQKPDTTEVYYPKPSFYPFFLALGVLLIAIGVVFTLIISGVGIFAVLASVIGWVFQNRNEAQFEDET